MTNIEALVKVYKSLGGEITDTYSDIADGAPVSDYTTITEIVSAIAKKSSGAIELPAVTSEDNGDVLTVANGAWSKAAVPSDVYRFTATAENGPDDTDRTVTLGNGETYANLNSKINTHILVCRIQDNSTYTKYDVLLGTNQGGFVAHYMALQNKVAKLTITSSSAKLHIYTLTATT